MSEQKTRCDLCEKTAGFFVIAVRIEDGDLCFSADYCRKHTMEVALSRRGGAGSLPGSLPKDYFDPTADSCYRSGCDCLPEKLYRCAACRRFADVWLTGGTLDDLDDLEQGVYLCGPCTVEGLSVGALPSGLCRQLREVLARERPGEARSIRG